FTLLENLRSAGRAMPRNHVLGVERLEHFPGRQYVRNRHEWTQNVDLVVHECRSREHDTLVRKPDRTVRLAVHALEVHQLEGLASEMARYFVGLLNVRWNERIAFKRGFHVGRCSGQPRYAIRRGAVGIAHGFAAARRRNDERWRREDVMAGGVIGM